MKSSFNFENYRNNLAKELVDEHKNAGTNAAREKLDKEKKTLGYKISSSLNQVKRSLSKNENLDLRNEHAEMKSRVSFEEIDVSDKIPKAIKLAIDHQRINAIREELLNKKVNKSIDKGDKNFDAQLNAEIEAELKKRGVETGTGGLGLLKELVVNEITHGALFDSKSFNTVIDATRHSNTHYEPRAGAFLDSRGRVNAETKDNLSFNPDAYVRSKHPNDEKNRMISTSSQSIFFSHSSEKDGIMRSYFTEGNQVVIVNPESARFLKGVSGYDNHIRRDYDDIQKSIQDYVAKPAQGMIFNINSQTTWADMAEWIVDLSAGKAYKIKEASDPQSSD